MVARVPGASAHIEGNTSPPSGDHEGPPNPSQLYLSPRQDSLAPTDLSTSYRSPRLSLMCIRADKSAMGAVNRPLQAFPHLLFCFNRCSTFMGAVNRPLQAFPPSQREGNVHSETLPILLACLPHRKL